MSPNERERLVALLLDAQHWCQGAEARNADGDDVAYSDADAMAWDLTGAACHLFGWGRARQLFVQIDRYLNGGDAGASRGDSGIDAMVALQDWNDDAATTHADLIARLQSLPVAAAEADGASSPAGDAVAEATE
jgi:hypothetical protein